MAKRSRISYLNWLLQKCYIRLSELGEKIARYFNNFWKICRDLPTWPYLQSAFFFQAEIRRSVHSGNDRILLRRCLHPTSVHGDLHRWHILTFRASVKGLSWVARIEPESSIISRSADLRQAVLLQQIVSSVKKCYSQEVHCYYLSPIQGAGDPPFAIKMLFRIPTFCQTIPRLLFCLHLRFARNFFPQISKVEIN